MRVNRLKRRRPGDAWSVWLVKGRQGDNVGYLVTERKGRWTAPVAFVMFATPESLRMALAIRKNPALADKLSPPAYDYRGVSQAKLNKAIGGKLLWPVDSRGRLIKRSGARETFGSAVFKYTYERMMDRGGKIVRSFVFVQSVNGHEPRPLGQNAGDTRETAVPHLGELNIDLDFDREFTKKNSGSPAKPKAPKPGSNRGKKAKKLSAA